MLADCDHAKRQKQSEGNPESHRRNCAVVADLFETYLQFAYFTFVLQEQIMNCHALYDTQVNFLDLRRVPVT